MLNRPTANPFLITLTATLALYLAALVPAHTLAQSPAAEDPRIQAQALLEKLEDDTQHFFRVQKQLAGSTPEQSRLLGFRLDDRAIHLLNRGADLAAMVAALPEEDPLAASVRQRLQGDYEGVGELIYGRLEALGVMVAEAASTLPDKSGSERLTTEAFIQDLDDVREQYLAALARWIDARATLGLDNEQIRRQAEDRLLFRAEILTGNIRLATNSLRQLGARQKTPAEQEALSTALARTRYERTHSLNKLKAVTEIMDSLDMDSSEYKAILLAQEGLTFHSLDGTAIRSLLAQWRIDLSEFFKKRGGDLVLNALIVVLILVVFRFLARMARRLAAAALDRASTDKSILLKNTVTSLTGSAVMVVGLLIALSQVGISLGPMLAGLGIAGFIIGFALQDTLANFASGAMILLYRPYDVDDFVEVGGISGVVKKMNLVSTTITTFDNQTLIVPNSKIWGDVIKNVTKQKLRRVDMEFGISYQDDIAKAEVILARAAADHELVLEEPETMVRVHSLGESSVNLILRPWVRTEDYWTVYWDLTREVKLRFDQAGVSIPFPQRDVHLYPHQEPRAEHPQSA